MLPDGNKNSRKVREKRFQSPITISCCFRYDESPSMALPSCVRIRYVEFIYSFIAAHAGDGSVGSQRAERYATKIWNLKWSRKSRFVK